MGRDEESMSIISEKESHNDYGAICQAESSRDYKDDPHCHFDVEVEKEEKIDRVITGTTLARFWVLLAFSILAWMHCVLWNSWGPINESVEAVFPTWNSATVAMTVNWTPIMFVIFVIPMCFAMQRCGLRNITLLASMLLFLGTALRCITIKLPWITVLAELCSVCVGLASTVILAGPSLIAADWFPVNERTTAVAVIMGASQLGQLGSFLEPLLVKAPGQGASVEEMKKEIKMLLYISAGASGLIFIAILVYFPSKPKVPPSITSSTSRLDIYSGVMSLFKNRDFLLILLSYGVSIGPPIAWLPLLDYSLKSLGFHQSHAMWVGLSSVIVSSFFPIIYARVIDHFREHLRINLVILMLITGAFFFWFLLISYRVIPMTTWQVYISVVAALTFNYTTIPLFFELAVEVAYPVPEILVAGILMAADNLTSTMFLFVFLIKDIGYLWVTSTLVISCSFTVLPLLAAKIDYTKTNLDISSTRQDLEE